MSMFGRIIGKPPQEDEKTDATTAVQTTQTSQTTRTQAPPTANDHSASLSASAATAADKQDLGDPFATDPFADNEEMSEKVAGVPELFRSPSAVEVPPVPEVKSHAAKQTEKLPPMIDSLPICATVYATPLKSGDQTPLPLDVYVKRLQSSANGATSINYLEDLITSKLAEGHVQIGWCFTDPDGRAADPFPEELNAPLMQMLSEAYAYQKELRKPKQVVQLAPQPQSTGTEDIVAELKEALEGLSARDRLPIIMSFAMEELDGRSYRAILRQLLPEEKVEFANAYLERHNLSNK